MFGKKKNIVVEYRGNPTEAKKQFLKDADKHRKKGYFPISETYTPGQYGCASFLVALALCLVIIGILIFIYMLLVKPAGTLTVTYEYREVEPEKICPSCAETVKAAAARCRFCGYEF